MNEQHHVHFMVPLMIFLVQHVACCAKHGLQTAHCGPCHRVPVQVLYA